MLEFFALGGFGMYPVLIFGFLAVASAVLFLLRPERRGAGLLVALGVATATSGLLGFFTGVIGVFRYLRQVPAEEQLAVLIQGTGESLNNVVLALIMVLVTSLVAAVGAFRASRLPVATLQAR